MSVSLKDYGVGSVFAIDDYFDNYVNGDTILNAELIENIADITGANLEDYKDILIGQGDIHEGLKISDIETESDIVEEIKRELDNKMSMLYSLLKDEYGTNFKKRGTRPHEDQTHIQELIDEIKVEMESQNAEGKYVLVVMDKKLQREGSDKLLYNYLNEIAKLLKEESNILLVMYSSEPENLEDYDSVIEHLKEKMESSSDESVPHILALHLNYIDKEIDDEMTLKDLLVRYVLKSQKSAFLNIYKESFKEADLSLRNKLWNSDKDQNRALFYYDYLSEGQHVDDIIFDLFTNKFRSEVSEKLNQKHTMLINPLRKSMQRFTQSYSNESNILFLRFQKDLLVDLSYQVFKPVISSSDITFGDIIKVDLSSEQSKYYMVVGQECDLTVRHTGSRVLDSVQLVEMDCKLETINSEWLIKKINEYIKSSANGNNVSIYTMFSEFEVGFYEESSNVLSFLSSLGFDRGDLRAILTKIEKNTNIKKITINELQNTEVDTVSIYSISKGKERISVDTLWLDALTLCEEDGSIVLSKRTIENSHEIRGPLRKHIQEKYEKLQTDLISWVEGSEYNQLENDLKVTMINKALEFLLGKSGIKVTSKLTEDSTLELKIENAKRVGRIEYLTARDHHHSLIEYQTRIGGSSTPGI